MKGHTDAKTKQLEMTIMNNVALALKVSQCHKKLSTCKREVEANRAIQQHVWNEYMEFISKNYTGKQKSKKELERLKAEGNKIMEKEKATDTYTALLKCTIVKCHSVVKELVENHIEALRLTCDVKKEKKACDFLKTYGKVPSDVTYEYFTQLMKDTKSLIGGVGLSQSDSR